MLNLITVQQLNDDRNLVNIIYKSGAILLKKLFFLIAPVCVFFFSFCLLFVKSKKKMFDSKPDYQKYSEYQNFKLNKFSSRII